MGCVLRIKTCKKVVCERANLGQIGNKIRVTSFEVSIYEGLDSVFGVKK